MNVPLPLEKSLGPKVHTYFLGKSLQLSPCRGNTCANSMAGHPVVLWAVVFLAGETGRVSALTLISLASLCMRPCLVYNLLVYKRAQSISLETNRKHSAHRP